MKHACMACISTDRMHDDRVDVEEASKEAAPSSGGSGALSSSQAADAVRRVDGDLTEGGML